MAKTAKVTMDDLLAGSEESFKHVVAGDTVKGTVLSVKKHEVLIDLGAQGVGLVPRREAGFARNLKVGDEVIYSTGTVYGQNTFADMTITGITKSNSFINTVQAYAYIEDVNRIIEMPAGGYSMYAIYLRDKNQQTKAANMVEARIRQDSEKNPEINVTSRLEAMKTKSME